MKDLGLVILAIEFHRCCRAGVVITEYSRPEFGTSATLNPISSPAITSMVSVLAAERKAERPQVMFEL